MKDLFSEASDKYAQHRPQYPQALFDYLNTLVTNKDQAWDCGTGNGQIAAVLADTYTQVYATDISTAQIAAAPQKPNLQYSVQSAEQTTFPDNSFNLVTVVQAIHWFDFDAFYAELKRTARPNAILAVIGYSNLKIDHNIDPLIQTFYAGILGPYWDAERRYIDEQYLTIPFPFEEIKAPAFQISVDWTLEQLIAYLGTWSALKHYLKANPDNPLIALENHLASVWGPEPVRSMHFPLLLRIGKVNPQ